MTKNLNIRLEDQTFDSFTQYCESNRYSKTEILKDYIQRLIQGELQPFCNEGNDAVMIPPTQGLEEAIANHPKLKALELRIEGLIELVESKLSNDDVTQSNDAVTAHSQVPKAGTGSLVSNDNVMTDNQVMINNDKSLQNNLSENALEGASNDGVHKLVGTPDQTTPHNQVLEPIEETEPLETAKSEALPDTTRGDIPETSTIQGFTDKELADLLTKQGRKTTPSTVNRWRNGKSNPTGKNKNLFEEWEVKGDRWFRLG